MPSFAEPPGGQQTDDDTQTRNVQVNLGADVSSYSQQVSAAQAQTQALDNSVQSLTQRMGSLSAMAGKKLVHFSAADFAVLGGAVADAASLEKQLGTLRATSAITGSSMTAMKRQIDNTFTSFPVARSQVIQLEQAIANLGVSGPRNIGAIANTSIKLGAATGESAIGLGTGQVQLGRQMGNLSPESVADYSNALLTVSKNQGVAASGVQQFAQSIAPMARQAGIGEAAVLGISAAFQKAGADGYYAANTFNQIISDITQLTQTGSPELAKYASFVGQSTAQFRSLSGTQQFTAVFDQIARGGPQALQFVNSLGLGQRAMTSVQAVAQSGSLQQAIAQATGSSTNTANLDKASQAAMSGLTNEITDVRNQFTALGEKIGDPLLAPLAGLAHGLGDMLGLVNKVVDAAQPLPTILAAVGGGAAGVAGVALGHAGLIGSLALGRVVLGRGSLPRTAYTAGREVGTAIRGGASESEALALNEFGRRYASRGEAGAQGLPLRALLPFQMAMQSSRNGPGILSRLAGTGAGTGFLGALRAGFGSAARGAGNAGAWLTEEQNRLLRDSTVSGLDRSPTAGTATRLGLGGGGVFRRGYRAVRGYLGANVQAATSMAGDAAVRVEQSSLPLALRLPMSAGLRIGQGAGMLTRAAGAMFSPMGMLLSMVGLPLVSSGLNYLQQRQQAPLDRADASLNGITKYDQLLDKSSTNLATFSTSVAGAANRLAQFANTPLKQVATVTGADTSAAFSGSYKPTDATWASIAKGGTGKTAQAAALAYLQSLNATTSGGLSGDTLTAIKQDMLNAYGSRNIPVVNSILRAFVNGSPNGPNASQNVDYATLGSIAANASNSDFANMVGGAVTGIEVGASAATPAANRSKIAAAIKLGSTALNARTSGFYNGNAQSFREYMKQLFGGNAASYVQGTYYSTGGGGQTIYPQFNTQAGAQAELIKEFVGNPANADFLHSIGITPPDRSGKGMSAAVAALTKVVNTTTGFPAGGETTSQLTTLRGQGALGRYAAGNALFQQAATGGESAAPAAQFRAATQLAGEAAKQAGGNFADATGNLMRLSDSVGGASTATGALIQSAAQWERTLAGFRLPTLSQEGQLTAVSQQAAASMAAANRPGATSDTVQQAQQDQTALAQQQESYRQAMISKIQTLHSSNVQQERAQEDFDTQANRQRRDFQTQQQRADQDYDTQANRQRRDFQTQQQRAEKDYGTQVLRAQQDFQTQRLRSAQDYQLQVQRSTADFHRQLVREAEQASQTIYDPFVREQAKATADAGTLIYNLSEQNNDIEQQLRQLGQLKNMGISQQTIDTLQLASATNAQQVNTLVQSLQQNPNMVGQINSLVGRRVSDTTKLTQSPVNISYRQEMQDFQIQQQRGLQDFRTSQSRAAADQQRSMQRMAADEVKAVDRASQDEYRSLSRLATDHALSVQRAVHDEQVSLDDMYANLQTSQDRAAQDLLDSFKQYTGGFDQIFSELMNAAAGKVSQYAPQVGNLIRDELDKIKNENPWITAPLQTTVGNFHDSWNPNPQPYTPLAAPGSGVLMPGYKPALPSIMGHYATGGISLTQQAAVVSENGPELHLPLNATGQDFMAGLIARSLAKGITMAVSTAPTSQSVANDNSISFAGADIVVQAQDPNKMARELARQAKLKRLVSPVRH